MHLKNELEKWGKVVAAAGIKPDSAACNLPCIRRHAACCVPAGE